MPRPIKIALIWAAAILFAAFAITMAGKVGFLPTQLAGNLAAGTVLALSWIATTLIVRGRKKDEA